MFRSSVDNQQLLLSFTGVEHPVKLSGCADLIPLFQSIFRDFTIQEEDSCVARSVLITLIKTERGYQRESLWLDKPITHVHPLDAVCDFSVDLIHAFVGDHPGFLCLHCAAVKFKQGLVVFPSNYSTGKSILSVLLTSMGMQLFTDDALPITEDGNRGFAMGLLPRLRLPLPNDTTPEFKQFVDVRVAQQNNRYCYIKLDANELPVLGTTAKICGIVLLRRSENESSLLEEIDKSEAIGEMILRNFARQNPAMNIVDRSCSILEKAACYRLTCGNLHQAGLLLTERFK